jgi:uncharacterized membrane protein
MSRNLFILAGTLAVLAVASGLTGLFTAPTAALNWAWHTIALVLLVGALLFAILATLAALFEQVDRRNRERARTARKP